MILRTKYERSAYVVGGVEVLKQRPKKTGEYNHENLESYLYRCLADAAFPVWEIEAAF